LTFYEYYMVRVKDEQVQKVVRVPLGEGATVKDALKGAPPLADKSIWITRNEPDSPGKDRVLWVDWSGITHGEKDSTNYPLQPGDYLFVADKPGLQLDRMLSGLVAPLSAPNKPIVVE
jgi:hypothetical protein